MDLAARMKEIRSEQLALKRIALRAREVLGRSHSTPPPIDVLDYGLQGGVVYQRNTHPLCVFRAQGVRIRASWLGSR